MLNFEKENRQDQEPSRIAPKEQQASLSELSIKEPNQTKVVEFNMFVKKRESKVF